MRFHKIFFYLLNIKCPDLVGQDEIITTAPDHSEHEMFKEYNMKF